MLITVMKKDHLASKLEYITKDVEHAIRAFAEQKPQSEGWRVMNPFVDLYRLVFRLSNRSLGAFEVAEDEKLLDKVLDIFQRFEQYENPFRMIIPWFPVPDHFWRLLYTAKLFLLLRSVVKKKKRSRRKQPDTIQYLLDQGCSIQEIVTVSQNSSNNLPCE